jgi:hypothetical protein
VNDNPSEFEKQAQSLIELLTSKEAREYTALYAQLRAARALFTELVADRLEPTFNDYVRCLESGTLEDKRSVAKHLNGQLRHLGLSMECPRTKHAAVLSAGPGHDPARGRFRFSLIGSSKDCRSTIAGLKELPPLHLVPRPERVEAVGDLWRRRARRGGSEQSR